MNLSSFQSFEVHPKFQKQGKEIIYHDVGIIQLETPLVFGLDIQPICLPSESHSSLPETRVGDGITVQGYGNGGDGDLSGSKLTQIDVTIR